MKMGLNWQESRETIFHQFDEFCTRLEENIDKEQEQIKACKKKTELELKLAQEIKLNNELTEQMSQLTQRSNELDRICATFESHLTITDSDKNRLENAKETYELAKQLTGVRFDFSAPSNLAKGYIKSESRKLLQPFSIEGGDSGALWSVLQSTIDTHWPDKENQPNN